MASSRISSGRQPLTAVGTRAFFRVSSVASRWAQVRTNGLAAHSQVVAMPLPVDSSETS